MNILRTVKGEEYSMLYDFYPWKIDVDQKGTVELYEEKDYSVNKDWNKELISRLNDEEKQFFEKLGVNLMKTEIEEKVYDFHEDGEDIKCLKISGDFVLRGKLVEIPEWQATIYEDEEILGTMPETIKKSESDEMAFRMGNLEPGIIFKPPFFRTEDKDLMIWDSGYVIGSFLIIEE